MLQTPHIFFAHFWQGSESLAPATRNEIWTSKSGPSMRCFSHLDFEMCFAPQRRTFSTSQLQKVLRCFVHFDFDVLRVTPACNFSSRIWPDVATPAALASLLFDPPGPQNHWKKHTESRLFYLFAHLHLLSSDSFSFLILVSSSLRLSDSSHLCSSFLHIVGSLTSKLPLVMLHVIVLKRERTEREREKKTTMKLLAVETKLGKSSNPECPRLPVLMCLQALYKHSTTWQGV